MIMFSSKVIFLRFFRLVYHIKVTGLLYRNRQFAVSKSFSMSKLPVCYIKVTSLLCQNRYQFLLYRNHWFTVSKSLVCHFEVTKSPVCHVEVTSKNEIKSDKNKKSICKLNQKSK